MRAIFTILLLCLLYTNNGTAQCIDLEQHNTGLYSSWMSCDPKVNPFFDHGEASHWIIYQFPELVNINSITLWNLNHPDHLSSGVREIELVGSPNGVEWKVMDTLIFDQAIGHFSYMGQEILDLTNYEARFLMINILSNHGGSCYGFSEIKFTLGKLTTSTKNVQEIKLLITPNPMTQHSNVTIEGLTSARLDYRVVDMGGRVLLSRRESVVGPEHSFDLSTVSLASGYYVLHIITDQGSVAEKLLVIQD